MNRLAHIPAKSQQYLLSVFITLVVSGVCFGLSGFMGYRVVALILLLSVSLIGVSLHIGPVLLSAVLSAFIWDFFFIPPRFAFHVHTTEDTILLVMYFVIALLNGIFTYKMRRVEKAARLKEERANSVKLYNTILNSLSHELRTPIAAIIGAIDNLQTNKNLTQSDSSQLMQEISKAALRLNQQVENLLNISRLESGHIQPKADWCDITEAVYDVVSRVEENNPNKKISISVSHNVPFCLLDKGMLDQVLYNLVNNAAIHTSDETSIRVSASCHANLLEIVVEDDGAGFQQAEMKDVFHKFSRDKNRKNAGRGLGLSIVKGFTEAMSGRVELTRGGLGGACFTVTLPVRVSTIMAQDE